MRLSAFLFFFLLAGSFGLRGSDSIEIQIIADHPTSEQVIVGYTKKMTLIGEMNPEITVLDRLAADGKHQVDLSKVPQQTHLLWFFCEGYAPQFVRLIQAGERVSRMTVTLSRKRYVTIRYATNPAGPDFSAVADETVALTQFTYPDQGGAWELEQAEWGLNPLMHSLQVEILLLMLPEGLESGPDSLMHYWQVLNPRWGSIETHKPFDSMSNAPMGASDVYNGRDYPLKKGSSFFIKNTSGYAKLEVVDISTERPKDIKVIECSPKFFYDVAAAPSE